VVVLAPFPLATVEGLGPASRHAEGGGWIGENGSQLVATTSRRAVLGSGRLNWNLVPLLGVNSRQKLSRTARVHSADR
jgi:hypothetical protein